VPHSAAAAARFERETFPEAVHGQGWTGRDRQTFMGHREINMAPSVRL